MEYIPYGEVFVEERNNSFSTNFLFNAKELDNETGLYYYGARYLDPMGAMWLSVDPMWEKYAGMSPYNYCAGNPVKLVDPDGNNAKDYFLGFVGAFADNAVLGLGNLRGYCARFVTDARDFNRGLDAGDAFSIAQGANEMYTGGGMMQAGTATVTAGLAAEVPSGGSSTVVVVGGGVIILGGAAVAEHGFFMAAQGTSNLANKKGHLDESSKTTSSSGKGSSSAPAVRSKTLWKDGKGRRLDLENPNPGQRPGQLHVHDQKNKYIYKDGKLFGKNPKTGNYDVPAPREINKLLEDPQFQKAIQKGKEYLGE